MTYAAELDIAIEAALELLCGRAALCEELETLELEGSRNRPQARVA